MNIRHAVVVNPTKPLPNNLAKLRSMKTIPPFQAVSLKLRMILSVLCLLAIQAQALPSYTMEDESNGLSDFARFKDSLTGVVEYTDLKLGNVDDIEIRVRHLTHPATGRSVKAVCLLIPAGEDSPYILVRYIDADELPDVLKALEGFNQRVETTKPEPDMRAFYVTRGQIGLGVKYYGKWKGIVMTDGITRTFGDGNFSKLYSLLQEASEKL